MSAVHVSPVRTRRNWTDMLVVAVVVTLASLPYLLGVVRTGVLGFNAGLATIPLGPWLGAHPGLPWLDPNVGYVSQALGHLAATDILHGKIPWWNPYEAVGVPLAGEGQSAALFPLTPLLSVANGQLYFHLALEVIAGVATQRLLKELGLSRWVTVVGGILFGLNGTFAWLTNAPFNPVAFLPVILWGIERCRTRPLKEGWSGWLLIAGGLAMSVYAGFPETAYVNGLLALAWAAVRFFQQPAGARLGYAATVTVGGTVGLALSAPFFAAFSSATSHADIGGHAGAFATAHLPIQATGTLGLPYLYGPLFGFGGHSHGVSAGSIWGSVGGYLTAAVIMVALFGLLRGRDRPLRILLAAWIALTLAKSFGVAPVVHALNAVPGISPIAFGRYSPPSWELAMVVLAALGLEAIGAGTAPERRTRTALGLAGVATLVAVGLELAAANGLLSALGRDPGFGNVPVAATVWALATVLLLVVVGWTARPQLARWGMGLVLVVDGLIMFMVPQLSAPTAIPMDRAPVTFLQHHLGLSRFVTLGAIVPNYGSYFGIAEANAHDLPIPGTWANFVHHRLESNELPQQFNGVSSVNPKDPTPIQELQKNLIAYEAIGVKYVVTPSTWGDIPGHIAFADHYFRIWQLPTPAPFYWVLSGSCVLHPVSFDQVRAACSQPSQVVRSELDAPGWSARDNGRPLSLSHTGPLFAAVHLPAGTSDVSFSYQPPRLGLAMKALVGGAALALAAALAPVLTRRRRRHQAQSRARHAAGRGRPPGGSDPGHGGTPGGGRSAAGGGRPGPLGPLAVTPAANGNGHGNGNGNGNGNGHRDHPDPRRPTRAPARPQGGRRGEPDTEPVLVGAHRRQPG